nr:hypothetical protein [Sulfuricystis multivorans]
MTDPAQAKVVEPLLHGHDQILDAEPRIIFNEPFPARRERERFRRPQQIAHQLFQSLQTAAAGGIEKLAWSLAEKWQPLRLASKFLLFQPTSALLDGRRGENDASRTAQERRQEAAPSVGNHYEIERCRWFFKYLEKRVGNDWVHRFGRVDQADPRSAAMAANVEEVFQLTDLLDADLATGLFLFSFAMLCVLLGRTFSLGLDEPKIGMLAIGHHRTGRAAAASGLMGAARYLAEQTGRQRIRQLPLPDSDRTSEQQRMGQAHIGPSQALPYIFI